MLSASITPWAAPGRNVQSGPYPERAASPEAGLDRAFARAAGSLSARARLPARFGRIAALAHELRPELVHASDAELRADAGAFARDVRTAPTVLTLARGCALVREASRRHLGLAHYREQILGALALTENRLVEMDTGEGKTITVMMAAALAALGGPPVHVLTANDYLAGRDAAALAPVYEALGLTVGLVRHDQSADRRRDGYNRDVVYCTGKDVVFDYLRDGLALGDSWTRTRSHLRRTLGAPAGAPVLNGLHFAIVDEADSILIDEARTPLIISERRPEADPGAPERTALALAATLERGRDFRLDERARSLELTEAGDQRIAAACAGLGGFWAAGPARREILEQALRALHLFGRDRQYIVQEGTIQIVDEFTGRVLPDRTWDAGFHQLIEVKEELEPTARAATVARITYQRFFRRYLRLAGTTGTAREAAAEFSADYGLRVVRIPPHRPSVRRDFGLQVVLSGARKWDAVADAVERARREGRPVLVGTRSVEASEQLSTCLAAAAIPHTILNARQDGDEAETIARAGEAGRVTVATNMAGRGTDIRLGPGVAAAGGLHVILTEFHESRRVDRQLFGRSGRQGEPGSHEAVVSLDDELFRRYAPRYAAWIAGRLPPGWSGAFGSWLRRTAQRRAERADAALRRQTAQTDERFSRSLAFAGRPE